MTKADIALLLYLFAAMLAGFVLGKLHELRRARKELHHWTAKEPWQ